jgi:hypothetical protein
VTNYHPALNGRPTAPAPPEDWEEEPTQVLVYIARPLDEYDRQYLAATCDFADIPTRKRDRR